MGGFGMPVQKAKDFKGTLRRLSGYLRPHQTGLTIVIGAGVISTLFSVVGPKLLGKATTKVFEGYLARAAGRGGIDFAYVGSMLTWLAVLYVVSATFLYVQQYLMSSIAQNTVYALRRDVEAKFSRLPLKFFDSRTHGEILSRAVNDLDNISSTLQQNLTQLISSVLSVLGIIVMMLTISWIMTLVVLVTLPLSVTIVATIAKRSQAYLHPPAEGARRDERARRGDVFGTHHRDGVRSRGEVGREVQAAERAAITRAHGGRSLRPA